MSAFFTPAGDHYQWNVVCKFLPGADGMLQRRVDTALGNLVRRRRPIRRLASPSPPRAEKGSLTPCATCATRLAGCLLIAITLRKRGARYSGALSTKVVGTHCPYRLSSRYTRLAFSVRNCVA